MSRSRTPRQVQSHQQDLVRMCLAWDAAWTALRERGDCAAVDPVTAAEAEMICGEFEEQV